MSSIKNILIELGADEELVETFFDNGYENVDHLKSITDYELKNIIPQMLPRKRFALALVSWMLDNDKKDIEENLLLTAGIHSSQLKSVNISDDNDCKSSTTTNCSSSTTVTSKSTGSADTKSNDNLDLLTLCDIENIDLHVRAVEDLTNVENFVYGERQNTDREKSPDDKLQSARRSNPIWVLLNKYSTGKRIAALPEETNLTATDIKEIALITAEYLFSEAIPPKRQVLPAVCTFWAENYFAPLFPNTSTSRFYLVQNEKYQTKSGKVVNKGRATGALYSQLCLLRKKLLSKDQSAKLRASSSTNIETDSSSNVDCASSSITTPQKITRASCFRPVHQEESQVPYSAPAPEPDNEKLIDLRNNVPTHVSAELLQAWSDTHEIRMKELKETEGTLWHYITLYKGLALPNIGPSLIKKDFQLLFGDLESSSKLKDFLILKKENILKLANEVQSKITAQLQKEKVAVFLELAKEESIELQATGLLLLLPFLFPGVYQVNKNWKPTKSNVLNSFVLLVHTQADVFEAIEKLRNHLKEVSRKLKWQNEIHLQPFIIAVGTSWNQIDQTHLVVDKVLYSFPTILEAVEVCFQLFHSLHAQYPLECHNLWEFIQQAVYGIYTDFDWNHRSTSELAESLHVTLKRNAQTRLRKVTKK